MEFNARTTAGIRQFEQTAVAKLVAEGVPRHVAHAFVHFGLPKSGRLQTVKDHVCKMKYEKFLIEKTEADFKNPFRVGRMVPHVEESKMNKFFTEFSMGDIDAARFSKSFPEFEIVSRGRTYNQHSFYANKRYAECELLVTLVFRDAAVSGYNPRSLIDLGGNDTWHTKRGRDFVHCDCPVLSHRDVMRYKTREIFSASDTRMVCKKKFSDCDVSADYAIGVHSTYDITPKRLAFDMMRKKIKKFFGVINYIPGIETKPAGTYVSDGMVMRVVKPTREPPYVLCSFSNDPSLEYKHDLSTLKQYLFVHKRYDFVSPDGTRTSYVYQLDSMRGNSLVFSLSQDNTGLYRTNFMWSPPTRKMYYISLKLMGIKRMEVESELFDRLVLQAAGARNAADYDIVSLYRYAKSLRQRVSINNIVLSSGFVMDVDQLVYVVMAAYAVSAAYRVESTDYFKKATQQIVNLRGRGFLRNVFRLSGKAIYAVLLALPAAVAKASQADVFNDRIKALVAAEASVQVEVDKPHMNGGHKYVADVISRKRQLVEIKETIKGGRDPRELSSKFAANKVSGLHVECEHTQVCFLTRGVVNYDARETPNSTAQPKFFDYSEVAKKHATGGLEPLRDALYAHVAALLFGATPADTQTYILSNADRMIKKLPFDRFVSYRQAHETALDTIDQPFMIFRGVGSKAVFLSPPDQYAARGCVRFVLFYDKAVKYSDYVDVLNSKGVSVDEFGTESQDIASVASGSKSSAPFTSSSGTTAVVYTNDPGFVVEKASQGEYYMSGALPATTPPVDHVEESQFVVDLPKAVPDIFESPSSTDDMSEVDYRGDAESVHSSDSDAVESDALVPGGDSLKEFIASCAESEKVAVASGRSLMEFAIAVSRGEAPYSRFAAVAQGSPGNPVVAKVTGGKFFDFPTDAELPHMAVTDGVVVYDKVTNPPPDGLYVTSDVMRVYTGAAIKRAVESVVEDSFRCDVVCVDGPAGAGKTYTITHTARPGDVVLCETSGALKSTARDLFTNIMGWTGHAYTADAFLMHLPVGSCNTLFLDEAYRLHAGKVFAIIKLLKPKRVICYGDQKQIPVLSFIPGFDFVYHKFPFTSVERKKITFRMPADICFALTSLDYYDYHVLTMNPILRSIEPSKQYVGGMFQAKPDHVALLVYTQTVKEDLIHQGVKFVMTIGEAQGETFDHVQVYRHTSLPIALFYDAEQALVAVSRSRRSFQYVTADALFKDDSFVSRIVNEARDKQSDVKLSAHLNGIKGVADYRTFEARKIAGRPGTSVRFAGAGASTRSMSMSSLSSVGAVLSDDLEYAVDSMHDVYFGN